MRDESVKLSTDQCIALEQITDQVDFVGGNRWAPFGWNVSVCRELVALGLLEERIKHGKPQFRTTQKGREWLDGPCEIYDDPPDPNAPPPPVRCDAAKKRDNKKSPADRCYAVGARPVLLVSSSSADERTANLCRQHEIKAASGSVELIADLTWWKKATAK